MWRRTGRIIVTLLVTCGTVCAEDSVSAEHESPTESYRDPLPPLVRPAFDCQGPAITNRRHMINQLRLNVTNWGVLGSLGAEIKDPHTGMKVLGAEYPAGSNIEHLAYCALWIGAVVGGDTAVSTAFDAGGITELYPGTVGMEERSTRIDHQYYHPDAVSEHDLLCAYADTLTYSEYVPADPWSYRPHKPLDIRVRQESFAWSYEYAEDFVIVRYWITNIGDRFYSTVRVGFLANPRVGHVSQTPRLGSAFGHHLGYLQTVPSLAGYDYADTMHIMWMANNDGDPVGRSHFDATSATSVLGLSIIGTPPVPHWNEYLANQCWRRPYWHSFNWWHRVWGPQRWPPKRSLDGNLGEPLGDRHKYRRMANGEFDYDQMWAAMDLHHQGWIGRPLGETFPPDLARGLCNTVGLLAVGPFELAPGDSIPIVLGVAAGKQYQLSPDNLRFLPYRPDFFYGRLDFSDLTKNMQWAKWMYDHPGKDTDDDGCRGNYFVVNCDEENIYQFPETPPCDTVFYAGDGVADISGLSSPQSPQIRVATEPGRIHVTWDGLVSESCYDYFAQRHDFEGFNVYVGLEYQPTELSLVATWDRENYDRYRLVSLDGKKRWVNRQAPFTPKELEEIYGDGFDPQLYPDKWSSYQDESGNQCYFQLHGGNRGNQYAEEGEIVNNPIQRLTLDSLWDESAGTWVYSGTYGCTIDNLLPSRKYYVAVTAYDHGFPEGDLDPLESSVLDNLEPAYPLYPPDSIFAKNLKVSVYPNPYRIDGGYRLCQFEDPGREGFPERMRRINFTNLPPKATIKIFSLDGDLIRQIQHPDNRFSDSPSHAAWDVISRNTQAVVSGIYIYSVQSDWGTQVGKIVIIK